MNKAMLNEVKPSAELEISPALGSVCAALGGILGEGIDVHRCQAAKALGRIGEANSAHPLIKALLDEDEDVRTDAAEALLELASPSAQDQLLENLLGDPCAEVKLAAIDALTKLQDQRVVPWLRRMVKGRDQEINWDEDSFYSNGWDDWVEIQVRAIKALAEFQATEAIPDIIAALEDENAQDMTEVAFNALAHLGPDGISALANFLNKSSTRIRRRAAFALGSVDAETAKEPLLCALVDPSAEVRFAALTARSAAFPDDPALAIMLDDTDDGNRAEAIRLIGQSHQDTMLPLLEDPAACVQSAALAAIAKFDDIVINNDLIETLSLKINSRSMDVSVAASNTFAIVVPDVAVKKLVKLFGNAKRPVNIRLGALSGLTAIGGDQVMQALVAAIDDDERQIRLETMSALAGLADSSANWPNIAGTALLSALNGEYSPEIDDPAEASEIGDEEADETAKEDTAEQAPEPDVEVVAHISEEFPTSTLDEMLKEVPGIAPVVGLPDEGIELSKTDMERLAIARRVIGKKKMAAAPTVIKHDDIRQFAARVLGDIDQDDVVVELAAVLAGDDIETSLAAADSLARIGAGDSLFSDEVSQVLLAKLTTDNRNLKLLLIRALGACDEAVVSAQLRTYLSDADSFVRLEAIQALARQAQAEDAFQGLLDDPDPSVRMAAATAYAQAAGCDAVERLVAFACSFEGYHSRLTARLLRSVDADQASAAFLKILNDPAQRRVWSVAIEALEELNQHQEYASFS